MTAALRVRIEELEEEIRQLKAAFAPKVAFPLSWALDERESAIVSALFHAKGSFITAEALLLLLVGFDDDADEDLVRTWVIRLRRKLERQSVTILTRNRQGYSLEASGRAVIAEALGVVEAAAPAPTASKAPRGWCDGSDAIVRAGYARQATIAVIRAELIAGGFLSRSLGSISQRAQTLGFTSERAAAFWSAAEDEIVRDAYDAGELITEIRLTLAKAGYRRSRGAIQMRAISLGVAGTRTRTWTRDEKAIVRAGLDAGHTFEAIRVGLAEAGFERGSTSITRIAHRMGVNRAALPWSHAEFDLLRRRYAEKKPVREISAELGRNIPAVASMASKLGLRQRISWSDEDRAAILRALEAGNTLDVVSRAIGRPLASVSTEARRMGLQFPPAPRRSHIREMAA